MDSFDPRVVSQKGRRIIKMARDTLDSLYRVKKAQCGESLTLEMFYPVDLYGILSLLGWEVDRVTDAGYIGSATSVDARLDFMHKRITLGVKADTSQGRLNFSLAHEIGHIMLHSTEKMPILPRIHPTRDKRLRLPYPVRYEVEADRFAAELLMPPKAVFQYFQQIHDVSYISASLPPSHLVRPQYGISESHVKDRLQSMARIVATFSPDKASRKSLAEFFDVSIQAMAIRLIELQLIHS